MGSSLLDNINSEEFADENLLTGRPNQVHVWVEDEDDCRFWNDILKYAEPSKNYDVSPFQKGSDGIISTTKGKAHILKDTTRYGKAFIACVDSDYDYLLNQASSYYDSLQCPYVIQTQVYSIENFTCVADTLQDVCSFSSTCQSSYDFVTFCNQLSSILYPLLIWSLYFQSIQNVDEFKIDSDWRSVLPADEGTDTKTKQELLDKVNRLVGQKIATFQQKYPDLQIQVDDMANRLDSQFELKPNNAIEYIQGHALFSYILNVLVKPEHHRLYKEHIDQIKSDPNNTSKEYENLINHYNNMCRSCEDALKDNFRYKQINSHVASILNRIRAAIG